MPSDLFGACRQSELGRQVLGVQRLPGIVRQFAVGKQSAATGHFQPHLSPERVLRGDFAQHAGQLPDGLRQGRDPIGAAIRVTQALIARGARQIKPHVVVQ